jgi:hypothetical protein
MKTAAPGFQQHSLHFSKAYTNIIYLLIINIFVVLCLGVRVTFDV